MARRAIQVLPVLAFVATFGVFAVDKNREARTVLRSGRGLVAVGALVVGYVVLAVLLRRTVRWPWVPPLALAAVVLALAAWAIRPYYVDTTANRVLVQPLAPPPTATATPPFPPAVALQDRGPPSVLLATGPLQGIGHDASGGAAILQQGTVLYVRFANFDIEGVPDPQVHLIRGTDVRRPGGVALGRLKGNRGDVLDYAIPAGNDAGEGWTVLVWCRAFSVPVANATMVATHS